MDTMFFVLLGAAAVIFAGGLIYTFNIGKKVKSSELDRDMDPETVKHYYTKNPIFWAYILFGLIMMVLMVVLFVMIPSAA